MNQNLRCNEQIRISPVRVVNEANEQLGVMTNYEALKMAREAGLDLVEVAPTVRPPVCRIMDYGKWKYTQKKNQKKSTEQQLKEVRLRPKTDDHDREIKIRKAEQFLTEGDKVQFTMQFRGREQAHREIGFAIFRQIIELFGPRIKVERPPLIEGRNMILVVAPVKGGFDSTAKPAGAAPAVPQSAAPRSAESAAPPAGAPAAASPGARLSPHPRAAAMPSEPRRVSPDLPRPPSAPGRTDDVTRPAPAVPLPARPSPEPAPGSASSSTEHLVPSPNGRPGA